MRTLFIFILTFVYQIGISQIEINLIYNDPSCNVENGIVDGNIELEVNGGVLPYTYVWNNGSTSQNLSGLGAGFYTVTVTDSESNTAIGEVGLMEPEPILMSLISMPAGQNCASTIYLDVVGSYDFTVEWSGPDVVQDQMQQFNVGSGIYGVTVTDLNGCSATGETEVIGQAPLNVILETEDPTCINTFDGMSNGSIIVIVDGGDFGYQFAWTGPNIQQDIDLQLYLGAGEYSVTVTDGNGCTGIASATLAEPDTMLVTGQTFDDECFNSGAVELSVSGGLPPYFYMWSNATFEENITGVEAGNYQVTIQDAQGCETVAEFEVMGIPGIEFTDITIADPECTEDGTYIPGSINVEVTGGVPPYTWSWSDNVTDVTSQNQSDLDAGEYSVEATDANGCVVFYTVQLQDTDVGLLRPSLCLVTNDNIDGYFEVYWEDPEDIDGISEYRIYREGTSAGQFDMIGKVDITEDNKFVDENAVSSQQAYRYYVTAANACGDESPPSDIHKTIHLTINQGVQNNINLIWDQYDGVTYDQITIYRGDSPSSMVPYVVLPGNIFSYSDNNVLPVNGYYQIVITASIDCVVTRESFLLKSNISRIEVNNINKVSWIENVYPNPFVDQITIQLESVATMEVLDLNGKIIKQTTLIDRHNVITTNDWPSGIYMIRMVSGDEVATWRGVKD